MNQCSNLSSGRFERPECEVNLHRHVACCMTRNKHDLVDQPVYYKIFGFLSYALTGIKRTAGTTIATRKFEKPALRILAKTRGQRLVVGGS
jgi:hypothetical protein